MFALGLSTLLAKGFAKVLSPIGLLSIVAAIILGLSVIMGIRFVKDYSATKANNITLQQNVNTLNATIAAQTVAAQQDKAIAQQTLDDIRQHDAAQTAALQQTQNDLDALKTLRKPTSEDTKCLRSPYVGTILDRMRKRAVPGDKTHNRRPTPNAVTP